MVGQYLLLLFIIISYLYCKSLYFFMVFSYYEKTFAFIISFIIILHEENFNLIMFSGQFLQYIYIIDVPQRIDN